MATAESLILSIRDQIPDTVTGDDATLDGNAFSLATLLRWINDAARIMCHRAPVIHDWYALPSVEGQDVYELPVSITSVEQVYYDGIAMERNPEGDFLTFSRTGVSGQSYWFSPHVVHSVPRLFVASPSDRTSESTILDGGVTASDTSFTVDDASGFLDYGFAFAENELVRYAAKTDTTITKILRGQGGTTAATHADNSAVTEANLVMKVYRTQTELTAATSILEIPQGLWPVLELYVLAKVRSAEQSEQEAMQLRQEFHSLVDQMAEKAPTKGLRQGLQIKSYGMPF